MYCIQLLYRDERFVVSVGDLTDPNHFSLWTYVFRVFGFFFILQMVSWFGLTGIAQRFLNSDLH